MSGRDPAEVHRAVTLLELLFDLSFVVAVAQAANALHHALSAGDVLYGLLAYFFIFFGVWWPWVNFTWFASAYDTDDVPYRLLAFVQIAGVLVVAGGVPRAFEQLDFSITVTGYVIMRTALVAHRRGRPWREVASLGAMAIVAVMIALSAGIVGVPFVVLAIGALAAGVVG